MSTSSTIIMPNDSVSQSHSTGNSIENTTDNNVSPYDAVGLIERFLRIYNIKNNTRGSIVEGNDPKDPAFTNEKMEMFYTYMIEHKALMKENPEFCDVYDSVAELPKSPDNADIYMLVKGNKIKPLYWSYSYLSLLQIANNMHFNPDDELSILNIDQ